MKRLLLLALLLPLAANAAGPAYAPGSPGAAKKEANACAEGEDCNCPKERAQQQPATRQLPADLSDMLEEHFLSVQAEAPADHS